MFSRSTTSVQGDVSSSSIDTHMAVSGDGYFIVQDRIASSDNRAVFSGVDVYTRRGDFTLDKEGYLVNGSNYYLKGLELDPTTGNPTGSVPEPIQISNDFLPAEATTEITYRANLPGDPVTTNYDADIAHSEILNPVNFTANPIASSTAPSTITGTTASLSADAVASAAGAGASIAADAVATHIGTAAALVADAVASSTGILDVSSLSATGGVITVNGQNVTINAADTGTDVRDAINLETGTTGVTAILDGSNQLVLTSADADTDITLGGDATTLTEIGYAGGGTVGSATNLLTQGFSASETLTIDIGGNANTITFGTNDGAGEVSTLAELTAALSSISGGTSSIDGSGNLTVTGASDEDSITLGGTSTLSLLGTASGTIDATYLLTQGFAQGETLTIDIGSNSNTITFGTNGGAGEVSTLAELTSALSGISGGTASIDGSGNLSIVGSSEDDSIVIGGTATVGNLGLSASTIDPTNLLTQNAVAQGETLTVEVANGGTQTITFGTGVGEVSTLAELNSALGSLTGVTASVNISDGNISIVATGATDEVTLGGTADITSFGTTAGDYLPAQGAVLANDNTTFLENSIAGGAITVYDDNGSPINVQFRWAKVDSVGLGGSDTWNIFYLEDPDATNTDPMWRNSGQDYIFGSDGNLSPAVNSLALSNITIAGANIASLELNHGVDGLTQFDNPNGNAKVNTLSQDGMPSGELIGIQISDGGRIVGNYSNGLSLDIYEIPLVSFNADDGLKRIDGGAYEATSQSGQAVTDANGSIVGQALENSNTDIADEFSKLIVTQQAYSANSRIISTSDEMLQEALNMVR